MSASSTSISAFDDAITDWRVWFRTLVFCSRHSVCQFYRGSPLPPISTFASDAPRRCHILPTIPTRYRQRPPYLMAFLRFPHLPTTALLPLHARKGYRRLPLTT